MPTARLSRTRLAEQIVRIGRQRHVGRFVRDHPLAIGQDARACRMYGSSGTFIILTPISTSAVSPSVRGIAVEVLQHLLAAVVRLDAAAVQRERAVEAMAAAEGNAAAGQILAAPPSARRRRLRRPPRTLSAGSCWWRGYVCCARRVDADADDFLGRWKDAQEAARQPALGAPSVADRAHRAEHLGPQAEPQRRVELQVRKQDARSGAPRMPCTVVA